LRFRALPRQHAPDAEVAWFRVQGLGFRIEGFGFGVEGLGFRV